MTEEQIEAQVKTLKKAAKKTPLVLSAQSKQGVPEALRALLHVIDRARAATDPAAQEKTAAWQP
jgi:GTP-binding protein